MSHQAKKRFGQNFLIDTQVVDHIIQTISPDTHDNMLEIGAGLGALTLPLLGKLKQLHIIEIDRDLVAYWQAQHQDNLLIHQADILKFDLETLPSPLRIVGNLPYNISSPILIKMLDNRHLIKDLCFMLQKEVVDRITASCGHKIYGRLSVILQYYFEVDYLFTVPNTAFDPMPKIQSAILYLRPKSISNPINYPAFSFMVKQAFSMRRKTLKNCLKHYLTPEQTKINLNQRAETLCVSEFITLTQDYLKISNKTTNLSNHES